MMLIVSASVAAPVIEYWTDTPQEFRKGRPNKNTSRCRVLSPGAKESALLFFKFVLFYFAVQCALGYAQITCRIFAFIIVLSQCPNDQLLLLLLNGQGIIF